MQVQAPHRNYLIISVTVGAISVLLTVLSFAFAHGSPIVAVIVFGFLMPSILVGNLLGLSGTLTAATYAFVFVTQFLVSYLLCLFIGLIKHDIDRTKSQKTDA